MSTLIASTQTDKTMLKSAPMCLRIVVDAIETTADLHSDLICVAKAYANMKDINYLLF